MHSLDNPADYAFATKGKLLRNFLFATEALKHRIEVVFFSVLLCFSGNTFSRSENKTTYRLTGKMYLGSEAEKK